MIQVIVISSDSSTLSRLEKTLKNDPNVRLEKAFTRWKALDLLAENNFDLAFIDEFVGNQAGFEFIEELVVSNPFMNFVLISSLAAEQFHEQTEGLGVMAQLNPVPSERDIQQVIRQYQKIVSLVK